MQGKVCVLTGATSGIGFAAAMRLGAMGAKLVLVGRDRARGGATLNALGSQGSSARMHYADLSLLPEMKRVAQEIADAQPRIDVLVNCAGAAFQPREVTADGLERTFALNHLAYFVLANVLMERLRAAAPSRIVNVSSEAHRGSHIDFADLQFEHHYRGFTAYGRSKLANILFTRELAKRLAGTGVTANCLHPGFVNTRIGDNIGGITRVVIDILKWVWGRTPKQGAETVVYLAGAPEVAGTTGAYFSDCKECVPDTQALNDDDARLLWKESARITGVG